jgi:hypothetical protein
LLLFKTEIIFIAIQVVCLTAFGILFIRFATAVVVDTIAGFCCFRVDVREYVIAIAGLGFNVWCLRCT